MTGRTAASTRSRNVAAGTLWALAGQPEVLTVSDLLDELGPQAPTLLPPWTARDLAAHLVLREHDYLAARGLVVPGRWSTFAQRRQHALALRDFAWLTITIRQGPPPGFFRLPWVRRGPNLNEFFVHHEDLRRANGYGSRATGQAMNDALWRNVRREVRNSRAVS
jgi:uncharacterized protein (TIGR03085 family)